MSYKVNPFTGELDEVGTGGGGGGGDVNGPASSTDNNLAIFDGTTGKLIKDTGISSLSPSFEGDVTTLSNFNLPQTVPEVGKITMDGVRYIHSGGAESNFFAGKQSGNTTNTSVGSTGVGNISLSSLTSGISNTAFGHATLDTLSTGSFNTAIGEGAGFQCGSAVTGNTCLGWHTLITVAGNYNTAIGHNAMSGGVSGNNNVAIGYFSLDSLLSGSDNIAIGMLSGKNYIGAESNNICINNQGVSGENNTTRLGNTLTDQCFLYGISDAELAEEKTVVINPTTSQASSLTGSPSLVIKSAEVSILTTGPKLLMTIDRDFVVLGVISVTISQVGAVPDSQSSIGYNSPNYDNVYAGGLTFPEVNNQYNPITMPSADYDVIPAGTQVFLNVDSVDTGATTYNVRVVLSGFYL